MKVYLQVGLRVEGLLVQGSSLPRGSYPTPFLGYLVP